ncbi:MAG TPA: BatD family protein [Hanamia sp.]|nr:BatD family protein [Hanamia sp.]
MSSLIFLTAIFAGNSSFAQVKFSVVCPNKTIGKNDVLQIQFKVENASNVQNIIPPNFKNFNVVSGPNQESSTSNINGKVSQYVAMGFSLQPKSVGTFTIGPAKAIADGKDYESNPVTIKVTNASTQPQNNNSANSLPGFPSLPNFNFDLPTAPVTQEFDDYILKPGENVTEKTKKNLFVKLDISKTSCYVGEPIVASIKLYTRLHSETTVTDAPSFNGFSVNDLPVSNNSTQEKYNGRLYNVYTLRTVELYPLQAGKITLSPIISDNKVTFIKSEYANSQSNDDFFGMLENFGDAGIPADGLIEKDITLKTSPIIVTVKPLPLEDQPASFRGAVGDFTIASSLSKNKITTDDAGNLKVTISGKGNIQLINAPTIHWPAGIDGYDAQIKDNVNKNAVPMQGSKVFTFPFTASKPGNYKIDSLSLSFFDPETSTYKTVTTSSLDIQVTKGTGIPNNSYANNSGNNNAASNSIINPKTELITGIILILGIILLIILMIIKKNKNKDLLETKIKLDDLENEKEEKEKEFIIPENPLLKAHEKLVAQDSKGFFHTLDASLKKYLAAKFKVPANELTKRRLNEELDKCNVSLGTSLMLSSLMDEVEINLYAPPSNINSMNTIFEKASEVVSLLDKQVCN